MMKKKISRGGVFYDLKDSHFIVKYTNGETTIKYYFSSLNHLEKFKELTNQNREEIFNSLQKRFKMKIILNTMADLHLYKKVETRGFLVQINGGFTTCLEKVVLVGVGAIGIEREK